MRFRFDIDGDEHRAVCSNVSAGGAFLKASRVPDKGSRVVLREVFRGNRDIGLRVEGEVVWTIARATLDNPETGYAVQFSEAWTAGDTAPLKDFATILTPGVEHVFESAERDGQPVTLYRFPKLTQEVGQPAVGPSTYDALPEVDLASELDRLDRQQRRRAAPEAAPDLTGERATAPPAATETKALSYYTRARPKKKPLAGGANPTGPQAPVNVHALPEAVPPAGATSPLAVSEEPDIAPAAQVDPGSTLDIDGPIDTADAEAPHGSPRRRRFGGLLGLFGFGKEDGEQTGAGVEDSGFDHLSPSFDYEEEEGEDWYVSDDDPTLVRLTWKDNETEGVVEKVSSTMIAINTRGAAPLHYERVTVVPAFPAIASPRLTLHGTVTRIKDKHGDGSQTVLVRFSKVDERGRAGVFQDYLKLFE